jgi:nicotinamide mononucleotide transporter
MTSSFDFIIDWLKINWIETAGAVLTLVFLYLEVTRRWSMWLVGIASGLFYVYINYSEHLYAMMGLRSYDVAVSLYGLYCWRFVRSKKGGELPFSFIKIKTAAVLAVIGIIVYAAISYTIINFTDTPDPFSANGQPAIFFIEILTVTLSIIAVWMAARKIVESWYLWMIVNPCSIAVYLIKGMYPSTILYLVYAIFSVVGYIQWRKQVNR